MDLVRTLQTLSEQYEHQNKRLDQLESEFKTSKAASNFEISQLRSLLYQTIESIEHHFNQIDEHFQRIDLLCQNNTEFNKNVNQQSKDNIDNLFYEFDEMKKTYAQFQNQIDQNSHHLSILSKDKIDKKMGQALEESQYKISEDIFAFQKVLATKVDRSEIPLLSLLNAKINEVCDSKEENEKKIDEMEISIQDIQNKLQHKEEKELMVQRMQKIHEQLNLKVDKEDSQKNIILPLTSLQNQLNQFLDSTWHKTIIQQLDLLKKQINEIYQTASVDNLNKCNNYINELRKQLNCKADVRLVDKYVSKDDYKSTFHTFSMKQTDIDKKFSDYTNQNNEDMVKIKECLNTMFEKIDISMRFVEWFSEFALYRPQPMSSLNFSPHNTSTHTPTPGPFTLNSGLNSTKDLPSQDQSQPSTYLSNNCEKPQNIVLKE